MMASTTVLWWCGSLYSKPSTTTIVFENHQPMDTTFYSSPTPPTTKKSSLVHLAENLPQIQNAAEKHEKRHMHSSFVVYLLLGLSCCCAIVMAA
jgi:hypothetical protein